MLVLNRIRHPKRVAVIVAGFSLGVAIPLLLFLKQGRYCDPNIGAVGHPYWQFVDGKGYLVACGQRQLVTTYKRTKSGWEATSVSNKGVTNNVPLEFHWWGVVSGQPPDEMRFHRSWHFWMNSHG